MALGLGAWVCRFRKQSAEVKRGYIILIFSKVFNQVTSELVQRLGSLAFKLVPRWPGFDSRIRKFLFLHFKQQGILRRRPGPCSEHLFTCPDKILAHGDKNVECGGCFTPVSHREPKIFTPHHKDKIDAIGTTDVHCICINECRALERSVYRRKLYHSLRSALTCITRSCIVECVYREWNESNWSALFCVYFNLFRLLLHRRVPRNRFRHQENILWSCGWWKVKWRGITQGTLTTITSKITECPTLPKHVLFLVFYSSASWCFSSGCFTGKVRLKNTFSLKLTAKREC